MSGRTMVRWRVGMVYFFPFFLADFAADFFAAELFAAFFAAFLAGVFFAAFFAAVFFGAAFFAAGALLAGVGALRLGFSAASSRSAIGSRALPRALDSIRTTSDHRMWYVETSLYGITCTVGRLRPLKKTFCFEPSVRMSTLLSAKPSESI